MTKKQKQLEEELAAIHRRIADYWKRRRRGCTHSRAISTYTGHNGYLFQCERCRIEEHAWAPYRMQPDEVRKVSWSEFMAARPRGYGLTMIGDDE